MSEAAYGPVDFNHFPLWLFVLVVPGRTRIFYEFLLFDVCLFSTGYGQFADTAFRRRVVRRMAVCLFRACDVSLHHY